MSRKTFTLAELSMHIFIISGAEFSLFAFTKLIGPEKAKTDGTLSMCRFITFFFFFFFFDCNAVWYCRFGGKRTT